MATQVTEIEPFQMQLLEAKQAAFLAVSRLEEVFRVRLSEPGLGEKDKRRLQRAARNANQIVELILNALRA